MGTCWGSPANRELATSSISRLSSGLSQVTNKGSSSDSSSTTHSKSSNISAGSDFSAASGDEEFRSGRILPSSNLRIFTFSELKNATRNFRNSLLLGEGGFGKVYKGFIEETKLGKTSERTVAVKKLSSESLQGYEEWQTEVNFLGRLSHPNLVKLIGYCFEDDELLLVYEFMQRGSLENHLFGRSSAAQLLSWDIRMKIAVGAARAIAFLHTSEKQVIYRDFKASNILLDGSYMPKVSDFGLAKLGPSDGRSHVTTRVIGTYGYAAPEYVATGHLYLKSDVYGFGVVLIEILTGLRALDLTRPSGKHQLVDWIKPYLYDRRRLKTIMDTRLEGKFSIRSAFQVAKLALSCISEELKNRPTMKTVAETLERIASTASEGRISSISRQQTLNSLH